MGIAIGDPRLKRTLWLARFDIVKEGYLASLEALYRLGDTNSRVVGRNLVVLLPHKVKPHRIGRHDCGHAVDLSLPHRKNERS